jgi:hypothetical protein
MLQRRAPHLIKGAGSLAKAGQAHIPAGHVALVGTDLVKELGEDGEEAVDVIAKAAKGRGAEEGHDVHALVQASAVLAWRAAPQDHLAMIVVPRSLLRITENGVRRLHQLEIGGGLLLAPAVLQQWGWGWG